MNRGLHKTEYGGNFKILHFVTGKNDAAPGSVIYLIRNINLRRE